MQTLKAILITTLVLFFTGCSKVKHEAAATSSYWEALQRSYEPVDREMKKLEAAQNGDDALAACKSLKDSVVQTKARIDSLPVINVDTEVIAYSSKNVALLSEFFTILSDFLNSERNVESLEIFKQRHKQWRQRGFDHESEKVLLRARLSKRYGIDF